MSRPAEPAVELRGIDKRFGDVHANRDVSLVVRPGTIHGIVGENGAGKSTLMGILYGYYRPDRGQILVRGRPVTLKSPQDALVRCHALDDQGLYWFEDLPPTTTFRATPSLRVS